MRKCGNCRKLPSKSFINDQDLFYKVLLRTYILPLLQKLQKGMNESPLHGGQFGKNNIWSQKVNKSSRKFVALQNFLRVAKFRRGCEFKIS